jgi:hypothetical protein
MFQRLFGSRSTSRRAPARTVKPCLEALDDRILLSANLLVNEVVVNPPTKPDNASGNEYIELRPNGTVDLNNTWLVVLEGEQGGTANNNAGTIDRAINLSGIAAQGWDQGDYIVVTDQNSGLTAGDNGSFFVIKLNTGSNELLENGSMSVAVLQTAAGLSAGQDLDAGNDGVIDATFMSQSVTVYDAVGYLEDPTDNPNDKVYGFNVTPAGAHPADPDVMARDVSYTTSYSQYLANGGTGAQSEYNTNAWYAAELQGADSADPNPYDYDGSPTFGTGTTQPHVTTRGAANE